MLKWFFKKTWRLFVMELSTSLQYRTDLILWTIGDTLTPLVSLAIWYSVASGGQQFLSQQDVLTYYVIIMLVTFFTNAWSGHFFAQEILNGTLAKFLVRPMSVFWKHVINSVAEKVIKLLLPALLFFLVLSLAPQTFSPAIYNPTNIFLFCTSVALAAIIAFSFDMTLGLIAFWLEDALEIRRYKHLLDTVASGILIPYAFLPVTLQTIFSYLPFRYTAAAPAEILLGRISGPGAIATLGIQCAWVLTLVFLFILGWKQGLKRYAVPSQ